jgi:hypothetical protein
MIALIPQDRCLVGYRIFAALIGSKRLPGEATACSNGDARGSQSRLGGLEQLKRNHTLEGMYKE